MIAQRSGFRIADSTNPIFGQISLPDAPHSGFDLSFNNRFTSHMFQLIPVASEIIYPSDTFSLGVSFKHEFAPLVNPLFDDLRVNYEAFFVPMSQLDPDWHAFITNLKQGVSAVPSKPLVCGPASSGYFIGGFATDYGSLLDYFGYGTPTGDVPSDIFTEDDLEFVRCSAYPILAYWRIIADWYQNFQVENIAADPRFAPMLTYENGLLNSWGQTEAWTGRCLNAGSAVTDADAWLPFLRRYDRDFLSTATPNPQTGSAVTVDTSNGSFTIESFRIASALQRFAERTNLVGTRYSEQIKAHFGVTPSDGVDNRAYYLGSISAQIDCNGVTQLSASEVSGSSVVSALGEKSGQLNANGSAMLFENRTFTEHGILMLLQSVSIPPCYANRRDKKLQFTHDRFDLAWPELCNLGDEPILSMDIKTPSLLNSMAGELIDYMGQVCGYTERYWNEKCNPDEVHGEFADPSKALYRMTAVRELPIIDVSAGQTAGDYLSSIQSDGYSLYESRIFAYTDEAPIRSNVHVIMPCSRPFSEHNTPLV